TTRAAVRLSVSGLVRIPPSAPARVTSIPSRIHVAPSDATISQCQELHGSLSNRAGTYDSIVSPFGIGQSFRANKPVTQNVIVAGPSRSGGFPAAADALKNAASCRNRGTLPQQLDDVAFVQHAF